jgi:apolipoprotein D and lipocalin family protein
VARKKRRLDVTDRIAQDNGTVRVLNTATVGPQIINIIGTATPVDSAYGAGGAFVVNFPGTAGAECPGPNYIVQDYAVDWAIVQTQNWSTLYILSREKQPAPASIDVSRLLDRVDDERLY